MVDEQDQRHIAALKRYIACKEGKFDDNDDACRGCVLDDDVEYTPEDEPDNPVKVTLRLAPCWFLSEFIAAVVKGKTPGETE